MNSIVSRFPWFSPLVRRFPRLYQAARRQMAGWTSHVKGRIDPLMKRARLLLPEDFDAEIRFVDQLVLWRDEEGGARHGRA